MNTILNIIRECTNSGAYVTIRTDTYVSTLAYFELLFDEAKKDFPDLKPEKVTVKQYGGDTQKRTFGIEFKCPEGIAPPRSYRRIGRLEHTL